MVGMSCNDAVLVTTSMQRPSDAVPGLRRAISRAAGDVADLDGNGGCGHSVRAGHGKRPGGGPGGAGWGGGRGGAVPVHDGGAVPVDGGDGGDGALRHCPGADPAAPTDDASHTAGRISNGLALPAAARREATVWMGVMEVMERSGIARGLTRLLRPAVRRLYPDFARDEGVMDAVSVYVVL